MECRTLGKTALICSLLVLFILPMPVSAQGRRGGGLYGDWQIKFMFGENEVESILSFSRNQEGQYTGQWISFLGMNDMKDVTFADNKLKFTQVFQFGDQEYTSTFAGTIEEGKLSGILTSDQGEIDVKGQRVPRSPRGVGSWDMTITAGEREYTGTLTISADRDGKLNGLWKSSRGESKLSDVKYENRELSFCRVIKTPDCDWETTFAGTLGRVGLTGVFKSDRGEAPAKGKRIGATAMGTWNLTINSEQGERKQRLRVNSDLSAIFGSTRIKKVSLEGDKLSFNYALEFGDQTYDVSFTGKITESKLTGELETSQGTQKVTGTKRTYSRRPRTR
jgi:hypothetical protein